jgi:hypothetical protein
MGGLSVSRGGVAVRGNGMADGVATIISSVASSAIPAVVLDDTIYVKRVIGAAQKELKRHCLSEAQSYILHAKFGAVTVTY